MNIKDLPDFLSIIVKKQAVRLDKVFDISEFRDEKVFP